MKAPPEPLDLFAVAPPGLERLLAAELGGLGIAGTVVAGGVAWRGAPAELRRVNLHSRLASRVLVRLGEFRARSFIELERHAARLPWSRHLDGGPVRLRVSARKSRLSHQRAIAERLHRSLSREGGAEPAPSPGPFADPPPGPVAGESSGASPGPPRDDTDEQDETAAAQLFVVRVLRDVFTVSADSSGALLHRRGYRQRTAKAPLRENLAAALLLAGGFRADEPFLDPFCGSGTLPIEAALVARRIPPGLASAERTPRAYAFERWPDHDRAEWEGEVARAREAVLARAPAAIFGSDRDRGAVEASRENAERSGVAQDVHWTVAPLGGAPHPDGPGLLATNPPYGQRVAAKREPRDLWAALGGYLRDELPGWRLALLSPDPRLDGQLGIGLEEAARTENGGIGVRVLTGRSEARS